MGCETKHFQGYAMVFNKENYLSVEPLGKEKSFTLEAWVRLASLPVPGKPMKIFHAGTAASLNIVSYGRVSFSVKGNLPENVVFDTKEAMLKPLVWYVFHNISLIYLFLSYEVSLYTLNKTITNLVSHYYSHKHYYIIFA